MLNKSFSNRTESSKVNKLYASINRKMMDKYQTILDPNIFLHLTDYLSLKRQYTIECLDSSDEFTDVVFNGYRHIVTENEDIVCRYNTVRIYGDLSTPYRQGDKLVDYGSTHSDLIICKVDIQQRGFTTDGAFILKDTEKIVIYKR